MSDVEEYDDEDEVEEDETVPVVPAGYVPGNANVGGQAVVDGEVVTYDAQGNEVGRGQSTARPVEEDV